MQAPGTTTPSPDFNGGSGCKTTSAGTTTPGASSIEGWPPGPATGRGLSEREWRGLTWRSRSLAPAALGVVAAAGAVAKGEEAFAPPPSPPERLDWEEPDLRSENHGKANGEEAAEGAVAAAAAAGAGGDGDDGEASPKPSRAATAAATPTKKPGAAAEASRPLPPAALRLKDPTPS